MSQPVKIMLRSEQSDGEKSFESEVEVQGTAYLKGNFHYFKYEEVYEGLDPISTIVKVNQDNCTIIRKGPIKMNHKYIAFMPTESIYEGPHGKWSMETVTNEMNFEWDEVKQKGRLVVSYELYLQKQLVGEHEFCMEIQGEKRVVH